MSNPEPSRPARIFGWNTGAYILIIGTLLVSHTLPTAGAERTVYTPDAPPDDTPPVSLRQFFHAYGHQSAVYQETAPTPLSLKAHEEADDPWIANDKLQHLTFSFLSTLSGQYVLTTKFHWHHSYGPLLVSSSATSALGIGKEFYDKRHEGRFSFRDLAADGIGILLASGLILL